MCNWWGSEVAITITMVWHDGGSVLRFDDVVGGVGAGARVCVGREREREREREGGGEPRSVAPPKHPEAS